MNRAFARSSVLALIAALAIVASPAVAQVPQILAPGMIWPELTASDFDQMHIAAQHLYQGRSAGAVERWYNPDTQNAGSITLMRSFEMKGMSCRAMTYRIRFKQSRVAHTHYLIDWCELHDGSWKIVEQQQIS